MSIFGKLKKINSIFKFIVLLSKHKSNMLLLLHLNKCYWQKYPHYLILYSPSIIFMYHVSNYITYVNVIFTNTIQTFIIIKSIFLEIILNIKQFTNTLCISFFKIHFIWNQFPNSNLNTLGCVMRFFLSTGCVMLSSLNCCLWIFLAIKEKRGKEAINKSIQT